ncbi:MAG: Tim44 domain-containing protein [Rhodospirillales bacterium]|nr:MAG: Tim44 domain-containing protein [Rhodospirillales bacterium]
MDIILIALVAVFLVLRLRSVLGRRTGNERPPAQDPFAPPPAAPVEPRRDGGNVVDLPGAAPPPPAAGTAGPGGPVLVSATATSGVAAVRAVDPGFDPVGFGRGARGAFEMIVGAFAKGDSASLRPLLDAATFASFDAAIRDRAAQKRTLETTLIGFDSTEIVGVELRDSQAMVTVRFVTEQINVTRDADGLAVDGNPNTVEKVIDLWTFARDTRSDDPNWQLVRTATE